MDRNKGVKSMSTSRNQFTSSETESSSSWRSVCEQGKNYCKNCNSKHSTNTVSGISDERKPPSTLQELISSISLRPVTQPTTHLYRTKIIEFPILRSTTYAGKFSTGQSNSNATSVIPVSKFSSSGNCKDTGNEESNQKKASMSPLSRSILRAKNRLKKTETSVNLASANAHPVKLETNKDAPSQFQFKNVRNTNFRPDTFDSNSKRVVENENVQKVQMIIQMFDKSTSNSAGTKKQERAPMKVAAKDLAVSRDVDLVKSVCLQNSPKLELEQTNISKGPSEETGSNYPNSEIDSSSLLRASVIKSIVAKRTGKTKRTKAISEKCTMSAMDCSSPIIFNKNTMTVEPQSDGFENRSNCSKVQEVDLTESAASNYGCLLPKPRWMVSIENVSTVQPAVRTQWNMVNGQLRSKLKAVEEMIESHLDST